MTDAVSAFLLVTAACALLGLVGHAIIRRGLPGTLRRAGLAFYVAADAVDRYRELDTCATYVAIREVL